MAGQGTRRRTSVAAALAVATLGAAGFVGYAPAAAAPRASLPVTAVAVLAPAADTAVGPTGVVPFRVTVIGQAKRVTVSSGRHSLVLNRHGATWDASLPAASWLGPGRNRVLVTAVGWNGMRRYATRTIYRAGTPSNLGLRLSDASPSGGASVAIRSVKPVAALSVQVNGHDLTPRVHIGTLRQTLFLGAREGLVAGKNTVRVLAVRAGGGYQNATITLTMRSDAPIPFVTAAGGPVDVLPSGATFQDAVRGRVGAPVALDASATRAAVAGDHLTYSWRVLSGPRHARPSFTSPQAARTALLATAPGRYIVEVAVRGTHGATGRQRLKVDATPNVPPIGVPIVTQAPAGIAVGTTTYEPASQPLNLVLLDRGTLAALGNAVGGSNAASIQAMTSAIGTAQSSPQYSELGVVAILSAPAGYSCGSVPNACGAFEALLQQLFVDDAAKPAQNDQTIHGGSRFSTITLTSPTDHSVWRSSKVPTMTSPLLPGATVGAGDISGYLNLHSSQGGSSDPALFVPDTDLPFTSSYSSTATTNVMRIGRCLQDVNLPPTPGMPPCQTFPSGTVATCGSGPTGGFQVVVLWAASLARLQNQTFTTNSGCGTSGVRGDVAQIQAMTQLVSSYAHSGGTSDYMVIVQSIGSPHPQTAVAAVNQAWAALGDNQIAKLGGTPSVFDYLGARSGYALVGYSDVGLPGFGSPFAAEASGDTPHASATPLPAVVNGALVRNQRNDYVPQTYGAIPGGTLDGLETIATRPPTAWPAEDTAGTQAALAYLTQEIVSSTPITDWGPQATGACWGMDDYSIRDLYCDPARAAALTVPSAYPAGQSFTPADWSAVGNEITKELGLIRTVALNLIPNIEAPFLDPDNHVDFSNIVQQIENAVTPPPSAPTTSPWAFWLGIFGDVVGAIGGFIGGPAGYATAGAFVNGIAEAFGIGSQLVPASGGSSQNLLVQRVQGTAADVATDIAQIYDNMVQNIENLGVLLVTDYGKLARAANIPVLSTNGLGTATAIAATTRATNAWATPLLLSAAFGLDALTSSGTAVFNNTTYASGPYVDDAANFSCWWAQGLNSPTPFRPFPTAPPDGQYLAAAPAQRYLLAGSGDPSDVTTPPTGPVTPPVPPAAVLAPMFAPTSNSNDVTNMGLLKDHVFFRSFAFSSAKTITCPVSPGYPGGGLAEVSPASGQGAVFYTFARSNRTSPASYGLYVDQRDPRSGAWSGPVQLAGTPDVPDTNSSNLGQQLVPLAAASTGPGSLNVFYLQNGHLDNDFWVNSPTNPQWGGPGPMPGTPDPISSGGGIAATVTPDGWERLYYWSNNGIVYDQYSNTGWQGPFQALPNLVSQQQQETPLAAVTTPSGQQMVFYETFNFQTSNVMVATFANGGWSTSLVAGHMDTDAPLAATTDGAGNPCVVYTTGAAGTGNSQTNIVASCNTGSGWTASTIANGVGYPVTNLAAASLFAHQVHVTVIPPAGGFHDVLGTYTQDPVGGWQATRNLPVPPWRAT